METKKGRNGEKKGLKLTKKRRSFMKESEEKRKCLTRSKKAK